MSSKPFVPILEAESRKFFAVHETELIDIILFGSTLMGKEKPKDVDIILIFKNKINHLLAQQLRRVFELKTGLVVDVIPKTYFSLFSVDFIAREGLLSSGYSLIAKTFFSAGLGYTSMVMFTYTLGNKTKSERMRFYYALNGRNSLGVLSTLHAKKHTDTVIVCPVETSVRMEDFLSFWHIEFSAVPCLIPSRFV